MANIYPTNASSAYANLCIVNSDGSYEPLSNNLINGKSIIKCFLNYNDDKMQLIPSEPIDTEYLDKAIDLCSNRKLRLLLKEDPSYSKGPTVGINTCTVIIGSDGVWKAKHMMSVLRYWMILSRHRPRQAMLLQLRLPQLLHRIPQQSRSLSPLLLLKAVE